MVKYAKIEKYMGKMRKKLIYDKIVQKFKTWMVKFTHTHTKISSKIHKIIIVR